jgi:hypothetical protein
VLAACVTVRACARVRVFQAHHGTACLGSITRLWAYALRRVRVRVCVCAQTVFNQLVAGGPRRLRTTLPALVFCGLELHR